MQISQALKNSWKFRSIALALAIHALLFLWIFVIRISPEEKRALMASEKGFPRVSYPRAVIEQKGLHWLSIVLWNGNSEVDLYWGLSQLCLRGDAGYWKEEEGLVPEVEYPRPYRDVLVEYQPIGLLSIVVPAMISKDKDAYFFWLAAWLGILYTANLLMGLYLVSDGNLRLAQAVRMLWWSIGFLILFGDIAAARFDHFVATTMMASALCFNRAVKARGKRALLYSAGFGLMVSVGVFTKIVPGLVLVSGLLVLLIRNCEPIRGSMAKAALTGFTVGFVLLNALFYLAFGQGYWSSFTYHMERGIQAESLYAGILMLAHLAGMPLSLEHTYRSFNLITPFTGLFKVMSGVLLVGLILFISWRIWQSRPRTPEEGRRMSPAGDLFNTITIILLLAFMITNKVLSPQYMLWVAPFMAAGAAVREDMRLPGRIFLIATLLTQLGFPILWDLLRAFDPAAVLILNMRNTILIGLLVLLLFRLPLYLRQSPSEHRQLRNPPP